MFSELSLLREDPVADPMASLIAQPTKPYLTKPNLTKPYLTKPNLTKPNLTKPNLNIIFEISVTFNLLKDTSDDKSHET